MSASTVTFWGVRGSTPCPVRGNMRFGGNTSCVVVESDGEPPIIFDLGTGLRQYGLTQPLDGSFRAVALVTHLHWDHVQGLPFFTPVDRPGAELDIYGPSQDGCGLRDAFELFMQPPYFPIRFTDLRGSIRFHDTDDDAVSVGHAKVVVRPVPHLGRTNGYRVEIDGQSIVYIPDHQAPIDLDTVADEVLELADGADLLIHDAQFTLDEWAYKSHWGHCTVGYAARVAREAGVKRLALFHHDPAHDDDEVERLTELARREVGGVDEVFAAFEGQSVVVG